MSQPSDRAAPCVLVVDDDARMLSVISKSLEMIGGFRVVIATNGVEGLARYFAERPRCVVIDVRMPELDGLQLVRALRGDPASAGTPLVILTAMAQEKEKFAGMASGADRYLLKPIKPVDLVQAIRETLAVSDEERLNRLRELAGNEEDAR